jgi:hypothetical protein
LLSASALCGFVQHRHRERPESFSRWRVAHAGGTAGGVQLLALAYVFERLAMAGTSIQLLATGLIAATWAFFLGPLAGALGRSRLAALINHVGGAIALPSYLGLPLLLLA